MTNFITLVKCSDGIASYQIVDENSIGYLARLIKSTGRGHLPEQINIEKTLTCKNGDTTEDSLVNDLICTIKVNKSIEDNVSFDFLS